MECAPPDATYGGARVVNIATVTLHLDQNPASYKLLPDRLFSERFALVLGS